MRTGVRRRLLPVLLLALLSADGAHAQLRDWQAYPALREVFAVAASGDDDAAEDAGAIYVFDYMGSSWIETTKLFETDDAFYMLELVERVDEGPMSLAEATPAIRTLLVQQKQLEQAKQQLQPAVEQARSSQSLDQIAARYNLAVREHAPFTRSDDVPGLGQFNAAIGTAFGLRPGQVSGLVEANGLLYLVQLVSRSEPDRAGWQAQLDQQRQRVRVALADERWQQYLAGLRENAKIVDNRAELRRQQQQLANQQQPAPLF